MLGPYFDELACVYRGIPWVQRQKQKICAHFKSDPIFDIEMQHRRMNSKGDQKEKVSDKVSLIYFNQIEAFHVG